MENNQRKCIRCGCKLRIDNTGNLCSPCAEQKTIKASFSTSEFYNDRYYDLNQMQELLGLSSYEQARRKAQKGDIPGRIPGIRRYLFFREVVDKWLRGEVDNAKPVNLSEGTIDTIFRIGNAVKTVEDKLPIKGVVENFEKQLPLQEVAKGLIQFIQVTPPPDKVLKDILQGFTKK